MQRLITKVSQKAEKGSTTRFRNNAIIVAIVFVVGILAGQANIFSNGVQAEVRSGQKREAFKSGGARSEIVLREISATLSRIEKRMERIEERMLNRPQSKE